MASKDDATQLPSPRRSLNKPRSIRFGLAGQFIDKIKYGPQRGHILLEID